MKTLETILKFIKKHWEAFLLFFAGVVVTILLSKGCSADTAPRSSISTTNPTTIPVLTIDTPEPTPDKIVATNTPPKDASYLLIWRTKGTQPKSHPDVKMNVFSASVVTNVSSIGIVAHQSGKYKTTFTTTSSLTNGYEGVWIQDTPPASGEWYLTNTAPETLHGEMFTAVGTPLDLELRKK